MSTMFMSVTSEGGGHCDTHCSSRCGKQNGKSDDDGSRNANRTRATLRKDVVSPLSVPCSLVLPWSLTIQETWRRTRVLGIVGSLGLAHRTHKRTFLTHLWVVRSCRRTLSILLACNTPTIRNNLEYSIQQCNPKEEAIVPYRSPNLCFADSKTNCVGIETLFCAFLGSRCGGFLISPNSLPHLIRCFRVRCRNTT